MRRLTALLTALILSLTLAACSAPDDGRITGSSITPEPSPLATLHAREKASIENIVRAQMFKNFLTDNYNQLSTLMSGGISGIGFIDLDLDGGMEMLIFDAGASAAMGLQFFDIIDGEVECVSANIVDLGAAFDGGHLRETYVNANYFDDFRLMTDKETGDKFFCITSANGALDFSYSELIQFAADGEILTLTSLSYKYESYDIDTSELMSANFTVKGEPCDEDAFDAAMNAFDVNSEDTLLECKGVFTWEDNSYSDGLTGLLAMADKALALAEGQSDLY